MFRLYEAVVMGIAGIVGNSCSLGCPYDRFCIVTFVLLVFSRFDMRARFGFRLLQFLIFAYFLLLLNIVQLHTIIHLFWS